jgi:hypothetical protein
MSSVKFAFEGALSDLCAVLRCLCGRHDEIVVHQQIAFNGVVFTAEGKIMSLTVNNDDVPGTASVAVKFTTSKGKPAMVDGVPTWSVDNPAVVDSVTPAADGMSATLHITDTPGAAVLSVNADADLGAGVSNITVSDTITVLAAQATGGSFTFGPITPDAPGPGPT